jgi:hypothetical protein
MAQIDGCASQGNGLPLRPSTSRFSRRENMSVAVAGWLALTKLACWVEVKGNTKLCRSWKYFRVAKINNPAASHEQACLPCPARRVPTTIGQRPTLFIGRLLIKAIGKSYNARQRPLSGINRGVSFISHSPINQAE